MTRANQRPMAGEEWVWLRFVLPVLATLWLGELAAPISQLLRADAGLLRSIPALLGTAAFVGLYLWVVAEAAQARATTRRPGDLSTRTWLPVALMAGLSVLISSVYGLAWLGLFIFSAVACALRLPTRHAAWCIAALTLIAGGIGLAEGDPLVDLAQGGLLVAGIGASVATVEYGIRTTRELRLARAEIAQLAVAEERLRFARDLHDLLGHSLSLVALKCDLADQLLGAAAPERARTEIQEAAGVTRQALRDVREAVAGYRRPTLADELLGAQEMLAAAGIGCHVEGGPLPRGLPAEREGALAWALREGVTNVIRHSRAQRCVIRLQNVDGRMELAVEDDGRGPALGAGGGNGLAGLAERLSAVGGAAEARPAADGGFRLAAWVPLAGGPA